ncbi:MAG: hypothetical protein J2P28_14745, partial [Actinobacteria bacterium]|nr:hypothetical protein [Actinomycetota bacterium]
PQASPRLNLAGTAPGMLGGTGVSPLRSGRASRRRKQPRFGYGKRSPLRPAGSRSGVWLIGRRTGEVR